MTVPDINQVVFAVRATHERKFYFVTKNSTLLLRMVTGLSGNGVENFIEFLDISNNYSSIAIHKIGKLQWLLIIMSPQQI